MPCPDLGALRASIDDASGAAPAGLRDHVRACPACSDTLAELRHNAELAAPAIALTAPARPPTAAAAEAALARLEQRRSRLATAGTATAQTATARSGTEPHPLATGAPTGRVAAGVDGRARPSTAPPGASDPGPDLASDLGPDPASDPGPDPASDLGPDLGPDRAPAARRRRPGLGTRTRAAAAALVAALALTGLVATPGGRAAAASFLAQFRSQRFEVVTLDQSQSTRLEDVAAELVETGVFTGDAFGAAGYGGPEPVADRAAAATAAGFAVPVVAPSVLPAGVERTPERILVSRARETRITFDRDRALDYLRRNGRPDAQLPERYDGTRLVIQVPAVVVQQFAGRDGGPALLVGKAGLLGLDTEGGASLEELREVVLGLPGLPPETVAQLRAIGDWRTTLPLPVPSDEVRWRPATVEGAEAISFADQTGRLHALLWQRHDHIWGVAGVVGADEARDVANSLN
jgi:hypothetical protein